MRLHHVTALSDVYCQCRRITKRVHIGLSCPWFNILRTQYEPLLTGNLTRLRQIVALTWMLTSSWSRPGFATNLGTKSNLSPFTGLPGRTEASNEG